MLDPHDREEKKATKENKTIGLPLLTYVPAKMEARISKASGELDKVKRCKLSIEGPLPIVLVLVHIWRCREHGVELLFSIIGSACHDQRISCNKKAAHSKKRKKCSPP